jgi:hypothetical protein
MATMRSWSARATSDGSAASRAAVMSVPIGELSGGQLEYVGHVMLVTLPCSLGEHPSLRRIFNSASQILECLDPSRPRHTDDQ